MLSPLQLEFEPRYPNFDTPLILIFKWKIFYDKVQNFRKKKKIKNSTNSEIYIVKLHKSP